MEIKKVTVGTGELAYSVFGTGKINLVIEMGLGVVMGEWWQLAHDERFLGELVSPDGFPLRRTAGICERDTAATTST